jgi:hypothetical protein
VVRFDVTVYRVNEAAHQDSEVSYSAIAVAVSEDGSLKVTTETGAHTFGPTTWGAVSVNRVSMKERM